MNTLKIPSLKKIQIYMFFLLLVLTSWAGASTVTLLTSETFKTVAIFVKYACVCIIFLIQLKKRHHITVEMLPIMTTVICWFFIKNINTYDDAHDGGFLYFVMLLLFITIDKDSMIDLYVKYRNFIIGVALCGVFVYFGIVLQVGIPIDFFPYYDGGNECFYTSFGPFYIYTSLSEFRLCGIFVEPGEFGTYLALILCLEKYDLRKISNIILFVAGCLTFSLAFWIMSLVYFVFRFYKNIKLTLLVAFLILLSFSILNIMANEYDEPNSQYLLSRFEYQDGNLAGNNRSDSRSDEAFVDVITTSDAFLGRGGGYSHSIVSTGISTIKMSVVDYGILGALLIYGGMIGAILYFAKPHKGGIAYLCVFVFSLYQRPDIFTLVYFVLLFGGLLYIKQDI